VYGILIHFIFVYVASYSAQTSFSLRLITACISGKDTGYYTKPLEMNI